MATAGIAVEGNGLSSNIGWLAACLLAGWCVLVAGRRDGLIYWAGAVVLFGVEWIWVKPDPGWGAWIAGTTFTVVFSLLILHQIDLVAQLRAAQAGLAEQARAQERNRIARELHDILGHTLTVSLLHVQSARLAVEHDPADAARALAEAERLGRECLAEVRTTVGMLRRDADGEEASTGPLPGIDGLPALVERFRSAGADVTFTVEGDTAGLPATAGLAVYRIAAGGADQRGQARAGRADRGTAGHRRRAGDDDRGQPGPAGHRDRDRPGRGQHARARGIARRDAARRARAGGAGWCGPRFPWGSGRDPGPAGR